MRDGFQVGAVAKRNTYFIALKFPGVESLAVAGMKPMGRASPFFRKLCCAGFQRRSKRSWRSVREGYKIPTCTQRTAAHLFVHIFRSHLTA